MPEGRVVYLRPDHSSWWLLSPGITLYFDTVMILREDYENILKQGGVSSYHEAAARHLEALTNQGNPEIKIIDNIPFTKSRELQNVELVNQILDMVDTGEEAILTPAEIIMLNVDAYDDWIAYNERKLKFLHKDEQLFNELKNDLIPSWRDHQSQMRNVLQHDDTEIIDRFRENKKWMYTFTSLISAASTCIAMADSDLKVHDPMLVEYMPVIEFLERLRTINAYGQRDENALTLFAVYNYRMSRYGEPIPIDFKIKDIPKLAEVYIPIRKKLARIDAVLNSISENDPARAFETARREIKPLVKAATTAAKSAEYGFWAVGLFSIIAAILASPDAIKHTKDMISAMALVERNVGRFAGAYAVVADEMIIGQRQYFWRKGSMNYEDYRKTFWDTGK